LQTLSKKLEVSQLFRIKQSNSLLYLLLINHALATIACFSNDLAIDYQLVAFFIVIISARFYWQDYHKFQSYDIRYNEAFGWQLAKSENNYQNITILPTTVLTARFIVLHFRFQEGRKQAVLIVNDALEKQNYRHLLVELKVSSLSTMT